MKITNLNNIKVDMKNKVTIKQNIKENLRHSMSLSSISGISYMAYHPSRSLLERCYWFLIVTLMVAVATWQGMQVYNHYKERPVIVTVDKSYYKWSIPFPTVTICIKQLKNDIALKEEIKTLSLKYNWPDEILTTEYDDFVNYLEDLAFKNYKNYDEYKLYATENKKEYLKPEQYMEVLSRAVFDLNYNTKKEKHQKVTPIKILTFVPKSIERVFTERGLCYVVNSNVSMFNTLDFRYPNSSSYYQDYQTINYDLHKQGRMNLQMHTNNNSYIFLHSSNEVMDITDKGTFIRDHYQKYSRFQSEIVTTSNDVLPLTVEQKNCRNPFESDEKPLEHSPVYSNNLCRFECRIKISMKYCNCTPYYYRRLANEPVCNLSGLYCLSNHEKKLLYLSDYNSENCIYCPQNCDIHVVNEFEIMKEKVFNLMSIFELEMIFPEQIYVRNLIFSKLDLTVQIGGIFGLFLGCSLLSFVEIFYSLSLRLVCGIFKGQNKTKT